MQKLFTKTETVDYVNIFYIIKVLQLSLEYYRLRKTLKDELLFLLTIMLTIGNCGNCIVSITIEIKAETLCEFSVLIIQFKIIFFY